jgi:Do/DeqQ family serine protease
MPRIKPIAALAAFALASASLTATAVAEPLDEDAISVAAEKVVGSVVNISSTREVDLDLGPFASDPLFNDPKSPWYVSPDQRSQSQKSLGSGVIVTAQGRILTNAHVVDGADTIEVTLSDGTTYDAKVVGVDKMSDLAVVQLQGDVPTLPAIKVGSSSALRLGQMVLAIGDPFGVGQAVTMGIVSAKGRAGLGIEEYEDFIQTDAAINPGNSGGALVDLDGELVGINTAIASHSGGYEGIGFAIPTDMAIPIMDMLVKDGKVARGYIGVQLSPLTPEWTKAHAVSVKRGAGIESVLPDGPAAKAGLASGDVIIGLDGTDIHDVAHLRAALAAKGADKKIELTIMRGKDKKVIEAKTGLLPDDPASVVPAKAKPAKAKPAKKSRHQS